MRVGDHSEYALAERIDSAKQSSALTSTGCQHHVACSLKVVLVLDVGYVGLLAVSLAHDFNLELLCVVV